MPLFKAALLAVLLLAAPRLFAADDASDRARAAFQRGQTEYNLGNFASAATYFEETYRLKPVPALLFNIAQCYRLVGNMEKAAQTYRSYLRNAPPNDRNLQLGREVLAQVEKALASQSHAAAVQPQGLVASPPVSDVRAAAKQPAPAAQAAPASPVVPAADRPAPGTRVAVAVAPAAGRAATAAPAAATTSERAPTPAEPKRTRTWAWIAAGGSALALGGGALLGVKSNQTISDLKSGYHPTAQIDADSASAKSNASKANLLFAAGGALALVSATFFVLQF